MSKTFFFYSHLIEIESVITELDQLDLSLEQKSHLASLIDSSLHHTILDAILSELTPTDRKVFLNYLREDNKDKIWQFLNNKIGNIEEKVKKTAEDLKREMHHDLKEVRRRRRQRINE